MRPEQKIDIDFNTRKEWSSCVTRLTSVMFEITLRHQRETFFPGQEINGHLNLNLKSETQVTSKVA